ncbi:MAG: excisionase family DNA-binding protein [Bryobacteraceae bacterium]|jgi:excisionase family DNA binding protein
MPKNQSLDYGQFFTITEVAARTNASVAFRRKQVFLKHIPTVKLGRAVRIRWEDLDSYIAARTRPALAEAGGERPEAL